MQFTQDELNILLTGLRNLQLNIKAEDIIKGTDFPVFNTIKELSDKLSGQLEIKEEVKA